MSLFTQLRLELAREPGHPHGDPRTGWDIVVALDDHGRLDLDACRADAARRRGSRFVRDATVASGHLRQNPEGPWIFDLEPDNAPAENAYQLVSGLFEIGGWVSIVTPDGDGRTFGLERNHSLVADTPEVVEPFA